MKKMYLFLYSVSLIGTIVFFYYTNLFTEAVNIEDGIAGGGGNGNPGLFLIVFLWPFIMVFTMLTIDLIYCWLATRLNQNLLFCLLIISMISIMIIGFTTVQQANELREIIVEFNPSFDDVTQMSLLNTFSNSIFFNGLTFVMLLLICFFLGLLLVLYKRLKFGR